MIGMRNNCVFTQNKDENMHVKYPFPVTKEVDLAVFKLFYFDNYTCKKKCLRNQGVSAQ